ncbi:uncharacterized protein LOC124806242 [Hydra vulgaris]|uniref:uncharacterized protein LOC124806242 n=1 Tax=Hydra vulgaris TaxID=6087 RepID=UPI001F5E68A1|nr:uncharacterized protein LOC124806242 [Hydra vulgaris]
MPTHCSKLKIGCVIMLLRNLDPKAGLCNGTRMKVCALQNNYIDAEVLTGVSKEYRQFLGYSMTINKSQSQTFDRDSVYFKKSCFSHGLSCSRTKVFQSLFFKVDKNPIQGMDQGRKIVMCYFCNVVVMFCVERQLGLPSRWCLLLQINNRQFHY